MTENEIGKIVIDAAVHVHRELGPGLLETVYEVILAHELRERGLGVERQVPVAIEYQGIKFDEGFRADIIVEQKVILELKAAAALSRKSTSSCSSISCDGRCPRNPRRASLQKERSGCSTDL